MEINIIIYYYMIILTMNYEINDNFSLLSIG